MKYFSKFTFGVLLCSCNVDAPQTIPHERAVKSSEFNAQPSLTRKSCGPVPQSFRQEPLNLNPFYQKYCDADGVPILSSINVVDDALMAAQDRARAMLKNLDQAVIKAMRSSNARVAIIGRNELTTDIPEYSDLYEAFPNTDWDKRTRGIGATLQRPVSSGAEENLLCSSDDRYFGEDIFVHEFAHTIHTLGLRAVDPSFEFKLSDAYNGALRKGLWKNTYAGSDVAEYWAEGVQTWFNVNQTPQEGIHNEINTRVELRNYDPVLYNLIAEYIPLTFLPECP